MVTYDRANDLLSKRIDGQRQYCYSSSERGNATIRCEYFLSSLTKPIGQAYRLRRYQTSRAAPHGPLLATSKLSRSIKLLLFANHVHLSSLMPVTGERLTLRH